MAYPRFPEAIALRVDCSFTAFSFAYGILARIVNKMIKPKNNVYRGHAIEKVGHGKRAIFQTIINEKEWSAVTESEVKTGIDVWIDEGIEPLS